MLLISRRCVQRVNGSLTNLRCLSVGKNDDSGATTEVLDANTERREMQTRGSMASYLMSRKGKAPSFLTSSTTTPNAGISKYSSSNKSYNKNVMDQRRRSKTRSRPEKEDAKNISVPDEVKSYLNDVESMEELFRKGGTIYEKDADEFDHFCAEIFTESIKSKDGKYTEVLLTKEYFKTKIPAPRTLRRLVDVATPKIIHPVGSDGYALGQQAWKVLSKHHYRSYPLSVLCRYLQGILAFLRSNVSMYQIRSPRQQTH